MDDTKAGRIKGGRWGWLGLGGVMGGKWRQLYLNNKKLKKKNLSDDKKMNFDPLKQKLLI